MMIEVQVASGLAIGTVASLKMTLELFTGNLCLGPPVSIKFQAIMRSTTVNSVPVLW